MRSPAHPGRAGRRDRRRAYWSLLRFAAGGLVAATAAVAARSAWRHRRPGCTLDHRHGELARRAGHRRIGRLRDICRRPPEQINATGLLGTVGTGGIWTTCRPGRPRWRLPAECHRAQRRPPGRYQPAEIADGRVLRILLVSDITPATSTPLMASIIRSGTSTWSSTRVTWSASARPGRARSPISTRASSRSASPICSSAAPRRHRRPTPPSSTASPRSRMSFSCSRMTASIRRSTSQGSIAGFNDVRYWGDGGKGSARSPRPQAALAGQLRATPAVDVVVSHEPWAVQGIPRARC